jgi:protein TonB
VRPQLVFGPQPEFPEVSRRLREQGLVILQAIIGTDGRVENLEFLRHASPALDEAATRAISRWRYRPATLNGRAVRVYLAVTVQFALH